MLNGEEFEYRKGRETEMHREYMEVVTIRNALDIGSTRRGEGVTGEHTDFRDGRRRENTGA